MVKGVTSNGIVSITSSSIVVTFQIILIISLIYGFHVSQLSNYYRSIQYTALGTFTCLAMAYIVWIIEEFFYRLHPNETIWITFYVCFFLLLALSLILFYTFMLLRLKTTFEDTGYKISKHFTQSHVCIIILVTSITPIAVVVEFMGYRYLFYILILLLMSLYFIGLFHLTYAFNKKLFQITLSIKEEAIISPTTSVSSNENRRRSARTSSLSGKQLVLLSTIRKHTLLGCLVLFMILIDILIVIIYSIVIQIYIFWCIGWALTINIAALCVYLGFAVNQNQYYLLCNKCDNCCEILCNGIAEKNVLASMPQNNPKVSHILTVSQSINQEMENASDTTDIRL
eukprot:462574_1